jgi:hypothetical protein
MASEVIELESTERRTAVLMVPYRGVSDPGGVCIASQERTKACLMYAPIMDCRALCVR